MNKIINYFKSISVELKKVTWLSNEEVAGSTVVVVVVSFVLAMFLFVVDFGISELMSWFLER